MGTPELAAVVLDALRRQSGIELMAVLTQPDRPKGRELRLQASPVKLVAQQAGLRVLQPQKARDPGLAAELASLRPDLIVVAAFGQILPAAILELPRFGCLNVHTSLLPKYRGAAPIQAAIANGDSITGVTIMKMDEGMDTGPILAQAETQIPEADDSVTLHDRLAKLGAELLVQTIPDFVAGKLQPAPQDSSQATYAPRITRADGQIDWQLPARTIWNRLRAFTPWPGAFTRLPQPPTTLKIWEAEPDAATGAPGEILAAGPSGLIVACGSESLRILSVQREGGRRMNIAQFLAGNKLPVGERLV